MDGPSQCALHSLCLYLVGLGPGSGKLLSISLSYLPLLHFTDSLLSWATIAFETHLLQIVNGILVNGCISAVVVLSIVFVTFHDNVSFVT